jgi:hypothetical protein
MIRESMNYVVLLRTLGRSHYLLWREGEGAPDEYVIRPGSSQFLMANSLAELLAHAKHFGFRVADSEPVLIDLDEMFRVLAALRENRASSKQTCQALLEGWNALEDMSRAVDISVTGDALYQKEALRSAYDKLFYGNNLPAITPPNRSYAPLFTSEERKSMRMYLRATWKRILEYVFYNSAP